MRTGAYLQRFASVIAAVQHVVRLDSVFYIFVLSVNVPAEMRCIVAANLQEINISKTEWEEGEEERERARSKRKQK